jgi:membrane carboxypeptidase/penicillin-binding protein
MRLLLKFVVAVSVLIVLASAGFYYWLAIYSADLPDVTSLAQFLPMHQATAVDPCSNASITVLPAYAFGKYLPSSVVVAEDFDSSTSALRTLWQAIERGTRHRNLAVGLAPALICHPGRTLDFQTKTIRLAIRLERQFTNAQLLTIYMNHVYVGQELQGVAAAASAYFHKTPDQLDLAESATLAALIRWPNFYLNHLDKLVSRRNEILEKMASAGMITSSELQISEQQPLPNINGPTTKKR